PTPAVPMPVAPAAPAALDPAPKVHFPLAVQEQVLPEHAQSPVHVASAAPSLEPHATSNALADKPAIPNVKNIRKRRMLSSPCSFRGEDSTALSSERTRGVLRGGCFGAFVRGFRCRPAAGTSSRELRRKFCDAVPTETNVHCGAIFERAATEAERTEHPVARVIEADGFEEGVVDW